MWLGIKKTAHQNLTFTTTFIFIKLIFLEANLISPYLPALCEIVLQKNSTTFHKHTTVILVSLFTCVSCFNDRIWSYNEGWHTANTWDIQEEKMANKKDEHLLVWEVIFYS